MASSEHVGPSSSDSAEPTHHTTPRELAARFHAAWSQRHDPDTATPELLPVRLAHACAEVLPVDGAGLSLITGDFRVPLGASDNLASLAERLQFTHVEGPCLAAAREQRVQAADAEQLASRWPAYSQELFDHTPYRAVLALPIALAGTIRGALDLFIIDPARIRAVSLSDAGTVADRVGEALTHARAITGADTEAAKWSDSDEPAWLLSPAVHDRQIVWIAIGMLRVHAHLTANDALALLRAYSYAHDTILDTVAADLVNGKLDIEQVQG